MIKKVSLQEELSSFDNTIFGCRIQSTAAAYGLDEPFAQFWMQDNQAAICKLDDSVTLDASDDADFGELKDFILMTGAKHLLCDLRVARKLGLAADVQGEVMVYQNAVKPKTPASFELNPSLRGLYTLLCECETDTFRTPEFEPFYMDLSHRIRHGTATAVGVKDGDALVSCAICIAQSEDQAVVSAVATKPGQRKKGFGHAALAAVLSQLKQEKIYILRACNENEYFYKSFGFQSAGEFAELRL
jgi:predicted GNAT family N-acyltransferase